MSMGETELFSQLPQTLGRAKLTPAKCYNAKKRDAFYYGYREKVARGAFSLAQASSFSLFNESNKPII